MAGQAFQVRIYCGTRPEWVWVLQVDNAPTDYPMLVQHPSGARYWVGINEVSAGRAAGKEVGTRALWDLLKLPEPTIGNHFFF